MDQSLNPLAEMVDGSIERPCATFVPLARDGDPDPMLAGIVPNPPAAVSCVPNDAVRAVLGAARPSSLHVPTRHQWREDPGLVPWPWR